MDTKTEHEAGAQGARQDEDRHEHHDHFVIHIDRQRLEVERATITGARLRALPTPPIGDDRDLYEVVHDGDDILVTDAMVIHLKEGMRFITAPRHVTPGSPDASAR